MHFVQALSKFTRVRPTHVSKSLSLNYHGSFAPGSGSGSAPAVSSLLVSCQPSPSRCTVETIKQKNRNIFFVVPSSLFHLSKTTLFEKKSYFLPRCGGRNVNKHVF